ncbi:MULTISPECIES: SDR family oxidoreductase [Methylomonas]|uniref:SDR family oxidoreductase n=1 Tax=Methylomonas TaxID=416 RepID=UPI001231CD41|nr:SDR family oxidoreductase [Methylomonas rhizoryzae]
MNAPNRTVFITGCSSGIGYATAVLLKSRGFRVICSARKPEDVERLMAEGFECLPLDLADSASVHRAVAELAEITGGKIDGLFNNAAFGQPGAVEDLSREALRNQFETNFFGTHELTNLILPLMRKQGMGRIVYNSSVLGFVAMKFRGAYNASKFALEGLADTLRLELRGTGIHVVLVEPGPIESRFRANAFSMYKQYIDVNQSPHRQTYLAMEARLQKIGPAAPFTLPANAVAEKVFQAMTAKRPKARYRVTVPTHLFAWLKRLLPTGWLDKILVSVE